MDLTFTQQRARGLSMLTQVDRLASSDNKLADLVTLCQELGYAIARTDLEGMNLWLREIPPDGSSFSICADEIVRTVSSVAEIAAVSGTNAVPSMSVVQVQAIARQLLSCNPEVIEFRQVVRELATEFSRALVHPKTSWTYGERRLEAPSLSEFRHQVLVAHEQLTEPFSSRKQSIETALQMFGQTAISVLDLLGDGSVCMDKAYESWSGLIPFNRLNSSGGSENSRMLSKSTMISVYGVVNADGRLMHTASQSPR